MELISSSISQKQEYLSKVLARYWSDNAEVILKLPIPVVPPPDPEPLPPKVQLVSLPRWAKNIGVNGDILVPSQFVISGQGPTWTRTDWWGVVFWYLNGVAERVFEAKHGPIYSYSFRLKDWDPRLWERAWVNRMAMFLRRWAAQIEGLDEEAIFGPLPSPEVILTHDVDAIAKTIDIRLKQAAFHFFNAVRHLQQRNIRRASAKLWQAGLFLFSQDDYWCFERIQALEETYHLRSHFNIYAGGGGWRRHPKQLLIDPAYRADSHNLKQLLRQLNYDGWTIGLHQSFAAWADPNLMRQELEYLEQVLGDRITTCRQHWLRFSWVHTWRAQQAAGLELDTTLGFNNRSGFRNGAALRFHPWDFVSEKPMQLAAIPLVLMDSHLYDYADLTDTQRQQQLSYWLDEIRFVRGIATIVWHQRTMSRDYGWEKGFRQLLEYLQKP
jgi:hypothetical protein